MGEEEPKVVLKRVCSQRSYDLLPTYSQKENWEIRATVVPPNSMGKRKILFVSCSTPKIEAKRKLTPQGKLTDSIEGYSVGENVITP